MAKSDLELQIQQNEAIAKFRQDLYDEVYKEPEKYYEHPKQNALNLAAYIDRHLDLEDPWITYAPGAVFETLYECVQLLRTLAKDI